MKVCPYCGTPAEGYQGPALHGGRAPDGATAMCASCGSFVIVAGDRLRRLTDAEIFTLACTPAAMAQQSRTMLYLYVRAGGRGGG